jgi:parvulin-like peptidyl-prolyl isomerase
VVADVLAKEPAEAELRAFYDSHTAVFTTPARVQVQHIFCGTQHDLVTARARAEHAAAALSRGENFADVRQRYGDESFTPLPETLVPVAVVQRQLGPTLADAVLALREGEVSLPVQSPTGYHIFRAVTRESEQIQPYETVKTEVKAEFIRRQRDRALQQQLDRLRSQATIVLSPKAPQLAIVTPVEHSGEPEEFRPR